MSGEQLLEFNERYAKRVILGGEDFAGYIDWIKVAKQYAGLIIAPYQWGYRLEPGTHWYYGWDCASGCIWDASVIERIEAIEPAISEPTTS